MKHSTNEELESYRRALINDALKDMEEEGIEDDEEDPEERAQHEADGLEGANIIG